MINLGITTKRQSFGDWCEQQSAQVSTEQTPGAVPPAVTDDKGVKHYTMTNTHF